MDLSVSDKLARPNSPCFGGVVPQQQNDTKGFVFVKPAPRELKKAIKQPEACSNLDDEASEMLKSPLVSEASALLRTPSCHELMNEGEHAADSDDELPSRRGSLLQMLGTDNMQSLWHGEDLRAVAPDNTPQPPASRLSIGRRRSSFIEAMQEVACVSSTLATNNTARPLEPAPWETRPRRRSSFVGAEPLNDPPSSLDTRNSVPQQQPRRGSRLSSRHESDVLPTYRGASSVNLLHGRAIAVPAQDEHRSADAASPCVSEPEIEDEYDLEYEYESEEEDEELRMLCEQMDDGKRVHTQGSSPASPPAQRRRRASKVPEYDTISEDTLASRTASAHVSAHASTSPTPQISRAASEASMPAWKTAGGLAFAGALAGSLTTLLVMRLR